MAAWESTLTELIPIDACLVLTTDPKPRLRWTSELHERFVDAVTQLGGPDKTLGDSENPMKVKDSRSNKDSLHPFPEKKSSSEVGIKKANVLKRFIGEMDSELTVVQLLSNMQALSLDPYVSSRFFQRTKARMRVNNALYTNFKSMSSLANDESGMRYGSENDKDSPQESSSTNKVQSGGPRFFTSPIKCFRQYREERAQFSFDQNFKPAEPHNHIEFLYDGLITGFTQTLFREIEWT